MGRASCNAYNACGNLSVSNTHQSVFILLRPLFAEMSLAGADAALVDTLIGN
jgi:hypothetical protein